MPALKYYQLKTKFKTLKKSDVSLVYFLYGTEDYLKNETVEVLKKTLIEPDMLDLNYSVYHISDKGEKQTGALTLDNAISAANSLPFISEKKLIVIKNIHKLTESQDELLEKYIENPCRSTCLVLVGGEKLPKRAIFKTIENLFPTVNFYNLYESEIGSWIVEYTKTLGKNISRDAAEELARITGDELSDIKNEIDKLALYIGEKNTIEIDDVDICCGHFKENTIFELMPALAGSNTDASIKILANLLNSGEDEYMILAAITDRYKKYLRFIEYTDSGVGSEEAAMRAGVKFYKDRFISDASRFNLSEVKFSLGKILEAELKMKTGGDSIGYIEQLLFDLCLP